MARPYTPDGCDSCARAFEATGRYRNARGQVTARDLGNEKADLVISLIP